MKRMLRSRFILLDYCLVRKGIKSVFNYASDFEQCNRCKYYYEPKDDIVTRFVKGLNLYIIDKMTTYTIYTLQHAILLAMQIES